ncbi:MAG: YCF48-related protein [Candidatus Korobacteraceae bacterium]
MNQEIPNPLRKALARQAVGDVHPSPDVLTSFMERTLAPVENEVVTHHLAQCAECREIVFLASDAAEEETRGERALIAAAASRVPSMPAHAATSHPVAAPADKSRPRWTIPMRWAAIGAAGVLVCAGLVLQFSRAGSGHKVAPVTVATNSATPASLEAQPAATAQGSQVSSAKPPAPEIFAKAAPHRTAAAHAEKAPAQTTVARNAAEQFAAAPTTEPAPQASSAQERAGTVGGVSNALASAVPRQSSFAEGGAVPAVQRTAPLAFGKPQMGMHAVSAVRPQWRIGPDGHLERSMAEGQWTRVLTDQPATFRVVAVTENNVWAGGDGGALFHSSDGGGHWSKVSLGEGSSAETGAVVSIHFDDPQHGVVASDSGARWATTDGGVTWTSH